MSTKHTPGPWIAIHSIPEEGSECFWLRAQPGGTICRGFSQEIGTINGPQSGEQEANARLIAAAPEQHAEMLRYLPVLERAEADPELWERLTAGLGIATLNGYRAALAKATGSVA